jgi:uncharacterized membrane protein
VKQMSHSANHTHEFEKPYALASMTGVEVAKSYANRLIRNEFVLVVLFSLSFVGLIIGEGKLPTPLALLRIVLGLIYLLFIPGYALLSAVFPRCEDLSRTEHMTFAVGLSIAVVPPLALVVSRLPWGMRLWPIVVAIALFVACCLAVAWIRQRQLPSNEQFTLNVRLAFGEWWEIQGRTNQVLYSIFACAVLITLISATVIVRLPRPGDQFTELYILDAQRRAENYPRQAVVGRPVEVVVGVANQEGVPVTYRVDAMSDGRQIGQSVWVQLAPGVSDDHPMAFVPNRAGDDVEVEFLLFRDGSVEPYRSLRLWLNVTEGTSDGI